MGQGTNERNVEVEFSLREFRMIQVRAGRVGTGQRAAPAQAGLATGVS